MIMLNDKGWLVVCIIGLIVLICGVVLYYENNPNNICSSSNYELYKEIVDKYDTICYQPCIDGCEKEKFDNQFTDNCQTVCIKNTCMGEVE